MEIGIACSDRVEVAFEMAHVNGVKPDLTECVSNSVLDDVR